jgi:hypothetical protein
MKPKLASSQWSSCLSLLSAGIAGMCHHAWPSVLKDFSDLEQIIVTKCFCHLSSDPSIWGFWKNCGVFIKSFAYC